MSEKTRRVMEAYQIENEYGRTIEAYKDKLTLADASFDADFLRIGRVALVYKTVGNGEVGYWDSVENDWKPIDSISSASTGGSLSSQLYPDLSKS